MRLAIIIIATLFVLVGGACATAGGLAAYTFGSDGRFESDDGTLESPTRALVFEADDIGDQEPGEDWLDDSGIKVSLSAEARDGGAIFVGLAHADDIESYLDGFEHDVVTDIDFDPFRLRTVRAGGSGSPERPAEQDIWLESAAGPGRQEIEHGLESGDFRVVVMNADASPGIDAEGTLGVKIPWVFWAGIGLLIAGVVVALLAIVAIVAAAASHRSPPAAPAQPAPPPRPAEPPSAEPPSPAAPPAQSPPPEP